MQLRITKEAYRKMKYYIEACDAEISGFGKVEKIREGKEEIFRIYDIEILKQQVTSASAIINEETLAKFLFEKTAKGESTVPYRVWWHSHANMHSYFSSIDDSTIDQSTEFPYLISIVSNKKNSVKARLDIFEPVRLTQELDLIIEEDEDENLREACAVEVNKLVTVKKFYSWSKPKKGKKDSNRIFKPEDEEVEYLVGSKKVKI